MRLRRYYSIGKFRDEIILTRVEQEIWYGECLKRILSNTRYILDNLERFPEFKVNWQNYHSKGYYIEKYRQKKDKLKNPL